MLFYWVRRPEGYSGFCKRCEWFRVLTGDPSNAAYSTIQAASRYQIVLFHGAALPDINTRFITGPLCCTYRHVSCYCVLPPLIHFHHRNKYSLIFYLHHAPSLRSHKLSVSFVPPNLINHRAKNEGKKKKTQTSQRLGLQAKTPHPSGSDIATV